MKNTCTQLREVVSAVHEFKVSGFCVTAASIAADDTPPAASRCVVDGHGWEIRFHPTLYVFLGHNYCPGLDLVFLGESREGVTAMLSGKVTAPAAALTTASCRSRRGRPCPRRSTAPWIDPFRSTSASAKLSTASRAVP